MNKEQTNYMQAGRTFECSNCKPEKGYVDYHKEVKCECICHDTTNRIREEWIKFIRDSKTLGFQENDGDVIETLNFFLSKIDELLKSQREELLEKIEGMKKNMTTVFYDEDGYTRANAKGYNQALSDIQAHIKSLIGEE